MVMSMTAFARQSCDTRWGRLTIELRSVNHRYLEFSARLPDELRGLENELREQLRQCVKRGKLDCTLSLRTTTTSETAMPLDDKALTRLFAAIDNVASKTRHPVTINPMEVMRWPGILQTGEDELEALNKVVMEAFIEVLADLCAGREREGANLKQFLLQRCETINDELQELRTRLPEIRQGMRSRLTARLEEFIQQVDQNRLEQELVYMAQKMDVDEELDRITSHLDEVKRLLDHPDPVGRRLDFLMQELNREANTLSSKSVDKMMTRCAVEMKVLIEQMREQTQNIE